MPTRRVAKLNPDGEHEAVGRGRGLWQSPANNTNPRHRGSRRQESALSRRLRAEPATPRASSIRAHHRLARVGESYNQNKDTINQFKLEGSWHDDQFKFKYGVQFTRDEEAAARIHRSALHLADVCGLRPAARSAPAASLRYRPNLISSTFSTGSGFINGWGNGANLPPAIIAANGYRHHELLAGFEWRGHERRRVQQPGRRRAVHRQVHHVPEPRRLTRTSPRTRYRPYLSLATTGKIADMPLEDQRRAFASRART